MDIETSMTSVASESALSDTKTKTTSKLRDHICPPPPDKPDRDEVGRPFIYCKHCPSTPYGSVVATNFRGHFKKHGIFVETRQNTILATASDELVQLYNKLSITGQVEEVETKVLKKVLHREIIDEALVSLVVVRNLPFSLAEWPEFHTFCKTLNPQATSHLTTTHKTISTMIDTSWQIHKDIVRKKLQSAVSSLHLSLDIWTSPNRYLLLGICAHFVDQPDELRRKALLALRPVTGHSGEEQFTVLLSVLQDYGIVRQVGCLVGDNASTNDTLCRALSQHLKREEKIIWDDGKRRLRCIGHIINLVVQAFLFQDVMDTEELMSYDDKEKQGDIHDQDQRQQFRLLGPLGKLHNIVVYIQKSLQRVKAFLDSAKRMVPLDNRTRWNSWHQMLDVAIQIPIANAIDGFSKAHLETLRDDYLSPDEWRRLRTIHTILQPFTRATLETQGDVASLDRVLFTMDVLIKVFEKTLKTYSDDPDLISRIRKGWDVFDKYYSKTDQSPYYTVALILHPNRRTKYITANWKKTWQEPAFKRVKDLWVIYRDKYEYLDSYDQSSIDHEETQDLDEFDLVARDLGRYTRPQSQDEYDDYVAGDPYDIGKLSALQWWCQEVQRKRWPKLSLMAIDILSIPAMSDEPERVFSGARRTISWERARLTSEMVEKVECLKHWKRSKITNES